MICPPCREGAIALRQNDLEMAQACHEDCEAPKTCPCQHCLLPIEDIKALHWW